jgi:hypothetical protein
MTKDKPFLYATFTFIGFIYLNVVLNSFICSFPLVVKLLGLYVVLCNLLTFYRCLTTDPGFITENKYPNFNLQSLNFKDTLDVIPDAFNNTRSLYFTENNGIVKTYVQKYCTTCNIFRPYHAAHCNDCGKCIQEKDHHCVWIGTCIGRNNMKMFFSFLATLLILNVYCILNFAKILKNDYSTPIYVAIWTLNIIFCVSGLILVTFFSYNVFLALIEIRSRIFLNSPTAIKYEINRKRVFERLCTLRPCILSNKNETEV